MVRTVVVLAIVAIGLSAQAKDLGFRFKDGKCVNEKGDTGYNSSSYFGQCTDYSNAVLNRFNLDGVDFSGSKFNNTDLQLTTLNDTILTSTQFQAANLSGVEFNRAVIQDSDFTGAVLKNAKVASAEIYRVIFDKADFSQTTMSYITFDQCRFNGANFAGAELDSSSILATALDGANFAGASLEGASLKNSTLSKTDLSRTNLVNADLTGVKGDGATFAGANMRGASVAGASLQYCNFRSADLKGADLTNSHLENSDVRSATFTDAKVDGTEFTGARFNRTTTLPFSKEDALAKGMVFKGSHVLGWNAYSDVGEEWAHTVEALKKQIPDLDMEVETSDDEKTIKDKIATADILIVPELEQNYSQTLAQNLGSTLRDFVTNGGIVVVLADYNLRFVNDTGLFASTCSGSSTDGTINIDLPNNPLAKDLGATIQGADATFGCYMYQKEDGVEVVASANDVSLMFSKNMGQGYVFVIGYDFFEYNTDAEIILRNAVEVGL